MIEIRNQNMILDTLNEILNHGGIAEIKNEKRKGEDNIVVVEIKRELRSKDPLKK